MRKFGPILTAALGLAVILAPHRAAASFVLNFTEAGGNAVASGSGSFGTGWMRLR